MSDTQPQPEPQPEGPTGPPNHPPRVVVAAGDSEDDSRNSDPPLADIVKAEATENEVSCPHCDATFPIIPEIHGAIAECSECGGEFWIVGPQEAAT